MPQLPDCRPSLFRALRRRVLTLCFCVCGAGLASEALSQNRGLPPSPASASTVQEISHAMQARQFDEALRLSKEAIAGAPRDPRLWTLQAITYSDLNRPEQAIISYRHALEIAPDYLPALEGAAQLSYTTQRPDAEKLLQHVLELRPADQTAHGMLGALAFREGDCKGAAEHFAEATQVIAMQREALGEYSSCLVRLGRVGDALAPLRRLLELEPDSVAARYNLALAHWNAGQVSDAKAVLQPAVTSQSASSDELTLAAAIAESNSETQTALELLRRAILADPKNEDAYLDFANLAYNHASAQVGVDMVGVGLKQLPAAAALYAARGVLLCQLGKIDQAVADFDQANRLNPKLSFVGVAQGIAASQSHDATGALARFRREVKEHPDDALAFYLLAEALSELGKPKGSPEFAEEVAAAKRATRLDPKKVEAHDLLASAYLQAGDVTESIAESRAALAVNAKDQQALYHLVLALRRTDDHADIPALLSRLMQARDDEQTRSQQTKRYRLVEEAPAQPGPGPNH